MPPQREYECDQLWRVLLAPASSCLHFFARMQNHVTRGHVDGEILPVIRSI